MSPSVDPTPTESPTPNPSDKSQERLQRLDLEAAEKAYLNGTREYQRLMMAGGATKPTEVLRATTGGFQLEATMSALRLVKKNGWHTDRPATQVVAVRSEWGPIELVLTACEDTTAVKFLNKAGTEVYTNRERRYVHRLVATKSDGTWKIADGRSKAVRNFSGGTPCAK